MKIRVSKNYFLLLCIYIFVLLSFFFPSGFWHIVPRIGTLFETYIQPILFIVILFFYLKKNDKRWLPILCVFIIRILIVYSTHNNGDDIYRPIVYMYRSLTICMLFELMLINKFRIFHDAVCIYFSCILVINLVLMILYPNGIAIARTHGIEEGYIRSILHFIGMKNNFAFILIPVMIISAYGYYLFNKRYSIVVIILCVLNIFAGRSSTGIIACIFFIISLIVLNNQLANRVIKLHHILIGYLIASYGIIIIKTQERLSGLIMTIFNKDFTFSMRTKIWDQAIELIKINPILGYGNNNGGAIIPNIGVYWYAHNQVLDTLIQGGTIVLTLSFIFFIVINHYSLKCLDKHLKIIFYGGCITISAIMISESLIDNSIMTYGILIIGCNLDRLTFYTKQILLKL